MTHTNDLYKWHVVNLYVFWQDMCVFECVGVSVCGTDESSQLARIVTIKRENKVKKHLFVLIE